MANYFARCGSALLCIGGLAIVTACTGDSSNEGNPSSPSGGGSSGACRTYPTGADVATTALGQTLNA